MTNPYRALPDGAGRRPESPRTSLPPLPLFAPRPPREFDVRTPRPLVDDVPAGRVDTSRAAFAEAERTGSRGRQQRAVLDAIAATGALGMTLDEVCLTLDLQTQSASPRVNELARAGLIKRSGLKRATRTGRAAHVWVTTARRTWRREAT